jgi:beta-lactamase class A
MIKLLSIIIIYAGFCMAQFKSLDFKTDSALDIEIQKIVIDLELNKDFDVGEDGIEQISFALIDMNGESPILSGYNYKNFIYPASVYKMYVAAEVLHQISLGEYSLRTPYIIRTPNDVDKSKEISRDPRPLLKDGDTVTIEYLLDLMITRSDNSAANCLIDVATRPRINQMMHSYSWFGSEVTRKFLKRKFEDTGYDTIRSTETSALHAAEFLYRIETNQLINYWVSQQMKIFLGRQLDKSKLTEGFPPNTMMYHKTGWWSYWTHDVAIVDDGKVKYIIACFLPIEEEKAIPKMKTLANKVHELMKLRNH